MKARHAAIVAGVCVAGLSVPGAGAGPPTLSAYDVQYSTAADGASPYVGQVVHCTGGIVTHKYPGSKPKLTLQHPAPGWENGWWAVQVKDFTAPDPNTGERELYDHVNVGDWVEVADVTVDEKYGTTLLVYAASSTHNRASIGNPIPPPVTVPPGNIAAPGLQPDGTYRVADRAAEKYECMWLKVEDVTVTAMGLGLHTDNYELTGPGGACWAADYMNIDADPISGYDPRVGVGQPFQSVTGILEQSWKQVTTTAYWDYYQLVTTEGGDLVVPEPASAAVLLSGLGVLLVRRRRRAG